MFNSETVILLSCFWIINKYMNMRNQTSMFYHIKTNKIIVNHWHVKKIKFVVISIIPKFIGVDLDGNKIKYSFNIQFNKDSARFFMYKYFFVFYLMWLNEKVLNIRVGRTILDLLAFNPKLFSHSKSVESQFFLLLAADDRISRI